MKTKSVRHAHRFMKFFKIGIITFGLGVSACSPITASVVPTANSKDSLTGPITYTLPQCEVMRPDYQLNTQVVSFELVNSAGLTAGIAAIAGVAFDVNFSLQQARLTVSMDAVDPLDTNNIVGAVTNQSSQIKLSASVDVSFELFKLSPSYAYATPIAAMTATAMKNSIAALATQLKNQSPWSAHVLAVPEVNQIIINSGSLAGIQTGDQFAVYNVNDVWSGAPCSSNFVMEIQSTTTPIATFTASDQITGNRALLTSATTPTQTINQGAKVVVVQLNTGTGKTPVARAPLKKQVSIGSINSPVITFSDGTAMTLTDFFNDQMSSSVFSSAFVLAE